MSVLGRIAKLAVKQGEEVIGKKAERTAVRAARKAPAKPVGKAEQLPLFPGYDKQHRAKRLDAFTKNTAVREPRMTSREPVKPPMRVYHATKGDFDTFEVARPTVNSTSLGPFETVRHGVFFAEDPRFAEQYITRDVAGTGRPDQKYMPGGNVMPAYLNIQKPFDMTDAGLSSMFDTPEHEIFDQSGLSLRGLYDMYEADRWQELDGDYGADLVGKLREMGYDGAFLREHFPGGPGDEMADVWVAFDPRQIKSAIGNNGAFDPNNPVITKARGGFVVRRRK